MMASPDLVRIGGGEDAFLDALADDLCQRRA